MLLTMVMFLAVDRFPSLAGEKAQLFLKFDDASMRYELNPDGLDDISKLERPVRVIAVLGDARVGKSTTLNLIIHNWTGMDRGDLEDVFKTGDSHEPVTRDVWVHIIQPPHIKGSIVLLDVEGTDLGNDSQTEHLSMFTALISSGLSMFTNNIVGNSNVNFLYRVSRLCDLMFPNVSHDNFPKLQVVVRSELDKQNGFEDYIKNSTVEPSFNKNLQEERRTIGNRFPKEKIQVSQIPFVHDRTLLKKFDKLRGSNYWEPMKNLAEHFANFPDKKTLKGSSNSGRELAELACMLVETMNANSWLDFGNFYDIFERNICREAFKKLIQPMLSFSAKEIEAAMNDGLDEFAEVCALKSERDAAKDELKQTCERKKKEEEERKKTEEAERERDEAKRQKEHAEKERDFYRENFKDGNCERDWLHTLGLWGAILTGLHALANAFSDERLKTNIRAMPRSQYQSIGLREVSWEWNEVAQKTFGLRGEGRGVIAQEVKKLYPWAVTDGEDGYLRVNYAILHVMAKVYKGFHHAK